MRRNRVVKPVAKVRRAKRKPPRLDEDDDDDLEPIDGPGDDKDKGQQS